MKSRERGAARGPAHSLGLEFWLPGMQERPRTGHSPPSLTPERDPLSAARLIPSTCKARVREDSPWLVPPRTGGQADALSRRLSTQPYRTPLLFHLRARAFPAATSTNQQKNLIKHEANQMPNHQPSSCRVAEHFHHACARLAACRDLEFHSGVQRPLRGQELGWKKNKREETGQRPSLSSRRPQHDSVKEASLIFSHGPTAVFESDIIRECGGLG